jgi:hypothetical protein
VRTDHSDLLNSTLYWSRYTPIPGVRLRSLVDISLSIVQTIITFYYSITGLLTRSPLQYTVGALYIGVLRTWELKCGSGPS